MSVLKDSYKIPYSINVTKLDAPVPLTSTSGEYSFLKRPIKLKIIFLGAGLGFILPILVYLKTPLAKGGILGMLLVLIGWEWFVYLLLWPQDNKLDGWQWIIPTLTYWLNYKTRSISTRGDDEVTLVKEVMNFEDINDKGVITFVNGWVGNIYQMDGFASNMLFEAEKAQIVDAFERYMKLLPANVSVSIVTQFAPLDLTDQKYNASSLTDQQYKADLKSYAHAQQNMTEQVGTSFQTVTQWLLLSAPDLAILNEQNGWLEQQVKQGLAKSAVRVKGADAERLISSLYRA